MAKVQNNTLETKDKFWNFVQNSDDDIPELILYGAISSQQSWWEDRVTPKQFNDELAAIGDTDEIIVRINSSGGDVFAANAIYTRLKDHKAKITVIVDGWAASAATIIAMAGDVIKIPSNGVFMIHDPKLLAWDYYTAEEFIKMADELRVIKQSIINGYALKTGKDEKEISDLMYETTWWTGKEAVDNGFCDELMFEEVETSIENSSQKVVVNSVELDIKEFKTIPNMLLTAPGKVFENKAKPGTVINKTINSKEETVMIQTVEALEKQYPDLVANIKNEAAKGERERIKAINEMAPEGFDEIVNDAIYTNPIAAEQVAMKIVSKQKELSKNYIANRDEDVNNSNVNNVGAVSNSALGGDSNVDAFEAAINKVLPANK